MMRHRQNSAMSSDTSELSSANLGEQKSLSKSDGSLQRIFLLCLAMRIVNSLLVQTYFNPDEHWQGPEVAHRIAFGYGHVTWEWDRGIRSYVHPLLFVPLYKLLALLHLDTPWLMLKAPRLLQAPFAALGDLYIYRLSDALFGIQVAQWTLFSQLSNWFMFFCITRTLSNSLETVLTVMSLYYWPCIRSASHKGHPRSRKWALALAAMACTIRPTSAITWLYVGFLELTLARDKMKFIFLEVLPIGTMVLGITTLLDRAMYGAWVLVPLNFLKFNVFASGGDYYGTHKWHWYFSQGFTVMLFSFLPFTVAGIIDSKRWKVSGLILWVLGIYSIFGHKEFRFVLPVLPVALMFSGYSLAAMRSTGLPLGEEKRGLLGHGKWPSLRLAVIFLLMTNIPMSIYMSMVHQRGTEDVMSYLSREALKGEVRSILFLMPCHATPYYSALHQNIPMRFLDCTPSEERGIPDESDRFMMNPNDFMSAFLNDWSFPSHIILFDSEAKKLEEFLHSHSFVEVNRFFHAHFKVDRDLQSSVVVYAYAGW